MTRWTSSHEQYLREHAGRKTAEEIGRSLGKSPKAVVERASKLRVSLRIHRSRLSECPVCHQMRFHFSNRHMCQVCRLKRSKERALEQLHSVVRDPRGFVQPKTRSPRPKPPVVSKEAPKWKRDAAKEAHLIAREEWLMENLQRDLWAIRKQRIRAQKHTK